MVLKSAACQECNGTQLLLKTENYCSLAVVLQRVFNNDNNNDFAWKFFNVRAHIYACGFRKYILFYYYRYIPTSSNFKNFLITTFITNDNIYIIILRNKLFEAENYNTKNILNSVFTFQESFEYFSYTASSNSFKQLNSLNCKL